MRCLKKSSVVAALLLVAVVLLGANGAWADLEVSFGVPSVVYAGIPFTMTINVYNDSDTEKKFNRVAAGYATADMKIKGPYELDTTQRTLAPHASTSFTVNFRIFYGTGTIVPVAVFFAQDSYQNQNMKGGGVVGIKVDQPH